MTHFGLVNAFLRLIDFSDINKGKAAYPRYCILLFRLLQRAVHKAVVKNEETLISWLGVVGLRH